MHVFLSYARSSEEQASYAEQALREAGYVVWRDSELPAHLSYADVIEERLKSAKAVLVLWSAEGAKSQWVRAEADAARELGTLVQSSVDGTVPPIPFNQIQCANLKGWTGESDHAGWRKLHASIVALAGHVEAPKKSSKKKPASSVCVLPFQNMSGEAVPDYFCDGLSEDITSDLAKVSALSVVPRKTAFKFKGQEVDSSTVAEQLGVGYVLEGTVRRAGDRVRITAQLIDGGTGEHAWSDRYSRDFNDIFSVQDEISKAIVDALKIRLVPAEEEAVEVVEASSEASVAEISSPPPEGSLVEAHPAVEPEVPQDANSEPAYEAQVAEVSIADRSFEDQSSQNLSYPEEEWSSDEEWDADEEETERGFRAPEPRVIALGVVGLLAAILIGFFFWPERAAPVVEEEKLTYTVAAIVNVRSLPSRYNSRILGTLEPGARINVVPTLAGAQPDWLKIEDGPYVGGYVWRESTRPASESGDPGSSDPAKNTTQTKEATG